MATIQELQAQIESLRSKERQAKPGLDTGVATNAAPAPDSEMDATSGAGAATLQARFRAEDTDQALRMAGHAKALHDNPEDKQRQRSYWRYTNQREPQITDLSVPYSGGRSPQGAWEGAGDYLSAGVLGAMKGTSNLYHAATLGIQPENQWDVAGDIAREVHPVAEVAGQFLPSAAVASVMGGAFPAGNLTAGGGRLARLAGAGRQLGHNAAIDYVSGAAVGNDPVERDAFGAAGVSGGALLRGAGAVGGRLARHLRSIDAAMPSQSEYGAGLGERLRQTGTSESAMSPEEFAYGRHAPTPPGAPDEAWSQLAQEGFPEAPLHPYDEMRNAQAPPPAAPQVSPEMQTLHATDAETRTGMWNLLRERIEENITGSGGRPASMSDNQWEAYLDYLTNSQIGQASPAIAPHPADPASFQGNAPPPRFEPMTPPEAPNTQTGLQHDNYTDAEFMDPNQWMRHQDQLTAGYPQLTAGYPELTEGAPRLSAAVQGQLGSSTQHQLGPGAPPPRQLGPGSPPASRLGQQALGEQSPPSRLSEAAAAAPERRVTLQLDPDLAAENARMKAEWGYPSDRSFTPREHQNIDAMHQRIQYERNNPTLPGMPRPQERRVSVGQPPKLDALDQFMVDTENARLDSAQRKLPFNGGGTRGPKGEPLGAITPKATNITTARAAEERVKRSVEFLSRPATRVRSRKAVNPSGEASPNVVDFAAFAQNKSLAGFTKQTQEVLRDITTADAEVVIDLTALSKEQRNILRRVVKEEGYNAFPINDPPNHVAISKPAPLLTGAETRPLSDSAERIHGEVLRDIREGKISFVDDNGLNNAERLIPYEEIIAEVDDQPWAIYAGKRSGFGNAGGKMQRLIAGPFSPASVSHIEAKLAKEFPDMVFDADAITPEIADTIRKALGKNAKPPIPFRPPRPKGEPPAGGKLSSVAVPAAAAGGAALSTKKQPAKPTPRTDATNEIDLALASPDLSRGQKRNLRVTKGQLKGGHAAISADRLDRLIEQTRRANEPR